MNLRSFPIKKTSCGRAMLNLGSSARVARGWNNVDSGWIVRLGRHPLLATVLYRVHLLSEDRYSRIKRVERSAVVWDLRKGIPYPDGVFDVVYHSHLLEHIDRDDALSFIRECLRVLRPGGVIRVVVPDLELLARRYVDALEHLTSPEGRVARAGAVDAMIDQMIARPPRHRQQQSRVVRFLERMLVGNTDRAGILHRWMYDRVSLGELLNQVGFDDVALCDATRSRIIGWRDFLLDEEIDGSTYKKDSLYMEASRSTVTTRIER